MKTPEKTSINKICSCIITQAPVDGYRISEWDGEKPTDFEENSFWDILNLIDWDDSLPFKEETLLVRFPQNEPQWIISVKRQIDEKQEVQPLNRTNYRFTLQWYPMPEEQKCQWTSKNTLIGLMVLELVLVLVLGILLFNNNPSSESIIQQEITISNIEEMKSLLNSKETQLNNIRKAWKKVQECEGNVFANNTLDEKSVDNYSSNPIGLILIYKGPVMWQFDIEDYRTMCELRECLDKIESNNNQTPDTQ